MPTTRIAVVGAGGPTGVHLTRELLTRGREVCALGRRREPLERAFGETGAVITTADARDADSTRRAVDGCDLVVDCIGLPPERMDDHPVTARVIAAAAAAVGARILHVSSYWSYFPHRGTVVDERHPREGGHVWFQRRREAEDVLLAAGAAVVHVPDFFGPHVHTSVVQRALDEAAAGRPISWMGRRAVEREVAFVPDAMRVVADLSERDDAYGSHWALPGNGVLSADLLAEIAGRHLGRPVAVRAAPAWLLWLLTLGSAELRTVRPLIPHYVRPVRYDASKLRALLGEIELRPMEAAITATLDWLAAGGRGSA